jgi:hypothetical protein
MSCSVRINTGGTLQDAVDALIIAAGIELDDHLRFDHHDTSEEQPAGRPTREVRFNAMFGITRLKVVSVDVVVTTALPRGDVTVEALTHSAVQGRFPAVARRAHVAAGRPLRR